MELQKEYTEVDLYKLVLVALANPEGGLKGESFWAAILCAYGDAFFDYRTSSGLRGKWRKISQEVPHYRILVAWVGPGKVQAISRGAVGTGGYSIGRG